MRSKSDSSLLSGAFISDETFQKEFRRHQQSETENKRAFGVVRGDDFEDEVYFKRGRVVSPRFSEINSLILIFNKFVLFNIYQFNSRV